RPPWSGDAAADRGSDDAQFAHELRELAGLERLRAVGKRVIRIIVHFNDQAIGTGSDGSAGHWWYFVAAASAVRRISEHRQVRKLFDDRDRGDVEGIASVGFERAYAALAQDDVVVAPGENVLGAHQKFFHSGGHAALQENRFSDFTKRAKHVVVLHVTRADLEDVDVAQHHRNLRSVHHFADGEEAELVGGLAHQLEARLAHALERVRRSARLERAAAQDLRAGLGNAFRNRMNLLTRFDRTWPGGNSDFR